MKRVFLTTNCTNYTNSMRRAFGLILTNFGKTPHHRKAKIRVIRAIRG